MSFWALLSNFPFSSSRLRLKMSPLVMFLMMLMEAVMGDSRKPCLAYAEDFSGILPLGAIGLES